MDVTGSDDARHNLDILRMRSYAYFDDRGWRTRLLNTARGLFRLAWFEESLQRRVQGRYPWEFWSRMVPPEYTYSKGSWREVQRHGSLLRLDLSNATDHGAYFDFADPGDEVLFHVIKDGHTVLDIGANIGVYAMRFARAAPNGRVVSFEPHPASFERLQEHVRSNALQNVTVLPFGIGSKESMHRLYQVLESNSGMNRILPDAPEQIELPYEEVLVKPLGKAIEGLHLSRIDLIKIDVEGFEMEVLEGSAEVIEKFRPILFIELDDKNLRVHGSSARALVDRLRAWNYTVSLAQTKELITESTALTDVERDIICFP